MGFVLREIIFDGLSAYMGFGGSFISLDTSVRGTGVCLFYGGKLYVDTLDLTPAGDDELSRIMLFKDYLVDVRNKYPFTSIYLEGTIMGCNYKTTRILNILQFMPYYFNKELHWECDIVTKSTVEWHKALKDVVSYKPPVVKMKSKVMIKDLFDGLGVEGLTEDELDALGLGIACQSLRGVVE